MTTDIEVCVMQLLSSVELGPRTARRLEAMGTEAVTVVCDAALGTYVGQSPWIRNHAATLVGRMRHVQAVETLALLIGSDSPAVARRALRAMRRTGRDDLVAAVEALLAREDTRATLAAEAVTTLATLGTKPARAVIAKYETRAAAIGAHRHSPVVRKALARITAAPAGRAAAAPARRARARSRRPASRP